MPDSQHVVQSLLAPVHTKDADCIVNPETNLCVDCGVEHGDPCVDCGGRGFHLPACPWMTESEDGVIASADSEIHCPNLRCAECKEFRHASPAHKPTCSKAYRNCPGCIQAGNPHIAGCPRSVDLSLEAAHA